MFAKSGTECVLLCVVQDGCCRSVNYRKSSFDGKKNCELLHGLAANQPGLLTEDQNFDHYVLLQPVRDSKTFKCPDSRCFNGGRCVGGCGNETSFCDCYLPYRGKHCERNIRLYPRTCKDVRDIGLGTTDGENDLYLTWPECNQTAKIYCADMNTTNPKEYVTLPAGWSNNFALHYNHKEGYREEQLWTRFEKIRLNVDDMSVNVTDFKFAIASIPAVFHGFATAGDCLSNSCLKDPTEGNFHVDITGTHFLLPSDIPYSFHSFPECVKRVYKKSMSPDRRQWSGFCGGYCGSCWPTTFYLLVEGC